MIYDQPLSRYEPNSESARNDLKMALPCSRLKVPICIQNKPQSHKFSSVLLYDELFSSYALFWKSAPNDPKWPCHAKIPTCMLQKPPMPKFLSVSLYDGPFSSYRQILWHVHRVTLKWSDIFKVKCTHMHSNPGVQIFIRFALPWAVFGEIDMFDFSIGYNVKIKLSITLNELKISKFQKEKFMRTTIRSLW